MDTLVVAKEPATPTPTVLRIRLKWAKLKPYLYILPAALLITVFFIYSVIYTLFYSFTNYNGETKPKFVGLQNYQTIFTSSDIQHSMANTGIWVIATLVLPVCIGLFVAVVLQKIKGQSVFKNIFYMPYAISLTTTGVIWSFLLSPSGLDALFQIWHWNFLNHAWLTTPPLNTWSMIAASTWQGMGTNMVLFLVGLQALPKDPFEAAMIDGASGWRIFWSMTLPLLKPITTVVVGMAIVNSFKVFDIIWVMTQGGPYESSETLAVTMYRESFALYQLGIGSAIAIVLSVIVLLFSAGYLRTMLRQGEV